MSRGLGEAQRRVLQWLADHRDLQLTVKEIARALEMTTDQVKCSMARLHASGLVLKTIGSPARWSIDPNMPKT